MSLEKLGTDVRQEQIAQAALELVAEQGLSGLSIAALAGRIGLVPSAIYRHFRSKDAVLDAALDLIHERVLSNVRAVCDETPDALERLRRLLVRHAKMVRESQALPRILFAEEMVAGDPKLKMKVRRILRSYLQRIGQIARRGQREGAIRNDVSASTIAAMFLGLIQPAGILWIVTDGRFDISRHVRNAWRVFEEAIRAG